MSIEANFIDSRSDSVYIWNAEAFWRKSQNQAGDRPGIHLQLKSEMVVLGSHVTLERGVTSPLIIKIN